MSTHYYAILGLSPDATLAQIKQAYRKRAKELHPDRNPAPDSHEQFLALSEAYDYLISSKTPLGDAKTRNRRRQAPRGSQQEQEAKARAESRARAHEYAQMKFEAFKKTEHYKDSLALEVATRFATLLTSVFLLIILPLLAWFCWEISGRVTAAVISIVGAAIWFDVVKNPSKYFDFTDLREALWRVIQFEGFQVVGSLLINTSIFVLIGLDTLLSLALQWKIMISLFAIGFAIASFKSLRKFRPAISLGFAPFLFTSLLLINYAGAHSPWTEGYTFRIAQIRDAHGHVDKDVLITLEDNKYDQFQGIRFFFNDEQLKGQTLVTYTFHQGMLGWPVMTNCVFSR